MAHSITVRYNATRLDENLKKPTRTCGRAIPVTWLFMFQGGKSCWRYGISTESGYASIEGLGIKWAPGQLALHPGPAGAYSALR